MDVEATGGSSSAVDSSGVVTSEDANEIKLLFLGSFYHESENVIAQISQTILNLCVAILFINQGNLLFLFSHRM